MSIIQCKKLYKNLLKVQFSINNWESSLEISRTMPNFCVTLLSHTQVDLHKFRSIKIIFNRIPLFSGHRVPVIIYFLVHIQLTLFYIFFRPDFLYRLFLVEWNTGNSSICQPANRFPLLFSTSPSLLVSHKSRIVAKSLNIRDSMHRLNDIFSIVNYNWNTS